MVGVTCIDHLETSSICDNSCEYCPARLQSAHRPVGYMTMETFEKAMKWVDYCVARNTQTQLNLYGIGEPLLNPRIVEMTRIARKRLPTHIPLHLNTNGNNLTDALAMDLRDAGITSIDVTGHKPRVAAKAIHILRKYNIFGVLSVDFILHPNAWAGQVDWPCYDSTGICPWLKLGRVFVMWDGRVTQCTLDAFGRGILGSLADKPSDIKITRFALCEKCHALGGRI